MRIKIHLKDLRNALDALDYFIINEGESSAKSYIRSKSNIKLAIEHKKEKSVI